jgi:hypothetical protein
MRRDTADYTRLDIQVPRPLMQAVAEAAKVDDRSTASWCRQVLLAALRAQGFEVDKVAA